MSITPHPNAWIQKPSRETVAEHLNYDPLTGILRWKQTLAYRRKAGEIAGWIDGGGSRMIGLFRCKYPAANIVYLLMTGEWPSDRIDHKNNIADDNRWTNLRPATQTQNAKNKSIRSDNTSGYIGVRRLKVDRTRCWTAQINNHHIGVFTTAVEAAHAYDRAASELYGEFAYRNFPRRKRVKG